MVQRLEVYRDCPTEDTPDGYTSIRDLLDGEQGDQAASAITRYQFGGAFAPGQDIATVARVGRAVLVSATYYEGTSTSEQDLADAAPVDADAVTALVEAMCPWTEQGC